LAQREEIALGRAGGQSVRESGGDQTFTVEGVAGAARNADRLGSYRANTAHALASARASRSNTKLVSNLVLRGRIPFQALEHASHQVPPPIITSSELGRR
jgi:hypothetical protein